MAANGTPTWSFGLPSIIGLIEKIKTIYVIGNHDIDLVRWNKDKGTNVWPEVEDYSKADGKLRLS